MNNPRPTTEQPKAPMAPSAVREPSTTAVPTKPIVTSPQPKGPDSGGNLKNPALVSPQGKP